MTERSESDIIDEQSVRSLIRQLIAELAPRQPVEVLEPVHRLVEDLGYHSLALMELAFTLEDEFHLDTIDEEQAQKISTVHDVERHVIDELRSKGVIRSGTGDQEA
jgi:acyl carrier protein